MSRKGVLPAGEPNYHEHTAKKISNILAITGAITFVAWIAHSFYIGLI